MIPYAVILALLASAPSDLSVPASFACSDWSLAGYHPGMDVASLMDPIREVTSARPFEMSIELTAADRKIGLQEGTVCIDDTDQVRWVRAVVSAHGSSSRWEKTWKKHFKAQHYFPLGCLDYLGSPWSGSCRSIIWSDNACSAVLTESDGERTVRTISVRSGSPTFITVTKSDRGLEYRKVSSEQETQFTSLSCD